MLGPDRILPEPSRPHHERAPGRPEGRDDQREPLRDHRRLLPRAGTEPLLGGTSPNDALAVFKTNVEAHHAGLRTLRAGIKCSDVDKVVNPIYREAGLLEGRSFGTGHSVGIMSIWYGREEGGELRQYNDTVLEENMVVTMEPMVNVDGLGGFRHHDIWPLHHRRRYREPQTPSRAVSCWPATTGASKSFGVPCSQGPPARRTEQGDDRPARRRYRRHLHRPGAARSRAAACTSRRPCRRRATSRKACWAASGGCCRMPAGTRGRASRSPTSTTSCTARPWCSTRCWSESFPRPRWSPRPGFATCLRSCAPTTRACTTSSGSSRSRSSRAICASRSQSACATPARCYARWTKKPRARWRAGSRPSASAPSRSASSMPTPTRTTSAAPARSSWRSTRRRTSRSRPTWRAS